MAPLLFLFVLFVFLSRSSHLMLSLILLEVLSFLVLFIVASSGLPAPTTSYLLLALFSVFVMEGVIALSGMISLVSFTGSDYISVSSFSKF